MKEYLKNLITRKPTKRQFQLAFIALVLVLTVAKRAFLPSSLQQGDRAAVTTTASSGAITMKTDEQHHRIRGVNDYKRCFPDSQSVQIVAAERWGVRPVKNRDDAEQRKKELVYIGESPYYHVDRLYSSIPYLVPRAALLLHDIGQAFYDSLYVKGVPFNQLIVTSVLRSMDDVARLQQHNQNATERSCHLFGTTFDICYNRYHPLTQPVRDDTLKWVLSEVLRDKREEGRCYIKYEVKQGCFHMTVR